jgi:hypothetical protein
VRGLAFMESGELEEAGKALEESLSAARSGELDASVKSADYELGLTYDAFDHLAELTGRRDNDYAASRELMLKRLGVVSSPDVRGEGGS